VRILLVLFLSGLTPLLLATQVVKEEASSDFEDFKMPTKEKEVKNLTGDDFDELKSKDQPDIKKEDFSRLEVPASPIVESEVIFKDPIPKKDIQNRNPMESVSLEFKGAPIKEVLSVLSSESGNNFVFPDEIGNKKVFITLHNIPLDQALNAILDTYGLGMIPLKGNIIRIDTLDRLNGEKKNIDQIRKNGTLLQPTKVVIFRLSYANADKIIKMIQEMLPSLKYDERVKVQFDDRTNSLIVEAVSQDLEKIKKIIEQIDLQTPQVKIEIRVVEILKNVNKFLGINWGGPFRYDQSRGLGFGNIIFPNNMTSAFSVDTKAFGAQNGISFDTHFGSLNNIVELDLRLRMAELSSYTRGLQNTSVTVLDNQAASIEAGSEDYFDVPVGLNDSRLASVKSALTLKVKPHITADGSVQMSIHIDRDSPQGLASNSKAVSSKSITALETNMLRKSGETAVIGGLYSTSLAQTDQGVPFFSSIPILGALFRSKGTVEDKRELMILVTPLIVNGKQKKEDLKMALSDEAPPSTETPVSTESPRIPKWDEKPEPPTKPLATPSQDQAGSHYE